MSDKSKIESTLHNLESAFAGESMAHIKYLYFARYCRSVGDDVSAEAFEATAKQEMQHAFGHLDLLFPASELSPETCLQLAIEGETYEYSEMYPKFRQLALQEGDQAAAAEMQDQIDESKQHAQQFQAVLQKAAKRFAALARVEERHARHYQDVLQHVKA